MLDMNLGINVGNFEVPTEDEYENMMLEQVEEEMLEEGIVEILDDGEDENAIWDGRVEAEYDNNDEDDGGEDVGLKTTTVGQLNLGGR